MVDFTTTKLTDESLRMLRIIAALTDERQYEVVERLLRDELKRVQREGKSGGVQKSRARRTNRE